MKIIFNVKNIGFMLALFGGFFNCLQGLVIGKFKYLHHKIYWIESKFPSERNFKSVEVKNKHSLTPCGGIANSATLYLL